VNDFAGTPADIRLDRGLGSVATRYIEGTDPSRERIYLENALAKILASNLAVELRMRGIEAFHGDAALISGQSALVIEGRFLTIDEGNGTLRTLIGFGLGAAAVRTQVEVVYRAGKNTQLLAEAELATKNILHPGFAPIVGIGGGAGSLLAGATVAGITTISSERFFTTVEADTKRIAAKLADWVAEYYRRQGWSGP
jgi:hypothetical protein